MIGPGGEVVKQELEVGEVVEQQVVTMDGSIVQQVLCSLPGVNKLTFPFTLVREKLLKMGGWGKNFS